jgi:hypothetical protein
MAGAQVAIWHASKRPCGQALPWEIRSILAKVRSPGWRVVRAENPFRGLDQPVCSPGRLAVMITGHVPAVRVPP